MDIQESHCLSPAPWPPPYTIRQSERARRIFLQISTKGDLEIVIPQKRKRFNIDNILQDKCDWIEKILFKKKVSLANPLLTTLEKPSSIDCKALDETWRIVYEPLANVQKITLIAKTSPERHIILKGNTENVKLCHRILIRWLIQYAKISLIPWLKTLSEHTGLIYNGVSIRGQTTLWGSCNGKKNISLNYKLLFLPRPLAQHVIIHELCHLKYLNHSEKFWNLFKLFDDLCLYHKKQLKSADHYLPHWLYCV